MVEFSRMKKALTCFSILLSKAKKEKSYHQSVLYPFYNACRFQNGWITDAPYLAETFEVFNVCDLIRIKPNYNGKIHEYMRRISLNILDYNYKAKEIKLLELSAAEKIDDNLFFRDLVPYSKESEICVLYDGNDIETKILNTILLQINKFEFAMSRGFDVIYILILNAYNNRDDLSKRDYQTFGDVILSYENSVKYFEGVDEYIEISGNQINKVIRNVYRSEDNKLKRFNPVKSTKSIKFQNGTSAAGVYHKVDFVSKK